MPASAARIAPLERPITSGIAQGNDADDGSGPETGRPRPRLPRAIHPRAVGARRRAAPRRDRLAGGVEKLSLF